MCSFCLNHCAYFMWTTGFLLFHVQPLLWGWLFCFAAALSREFNALCSDSRIIILLTKAALLSALAVMKVPHLFTDTTLTSSFPCIKSHLPLPTVRAGFHRTAAPHFPCPPFFLPSLLQKGFSGQNNLQWLCPVCTWSNQNCHRQKGFQLSLAYWHPCDGFKLSDNSVLSYLDFVDAKDLWLLKAIYQ